MKTALELIVFGRLSDARVMLSKEEIEQKYQWIFEKTNLDKLPEGVSSWDYYFALRKKEQQEINFLKA